MRKHLLVTNDFPPKIGGIQNYLWELWRRLPDGTATVYTTPHRGTREFDAQQRFPIERSREPFLIPYPWLTRQIDGRAQLSSSELVILDPAIPLGAIGPRLERPTAVVLHGAEVAIPGRIPGFRSIMAKTLRDCSLVIAAGGYPLAEAERCVQRSLPSIVVPPGVDTDRFRPIDDDSRLRIRSSYGIGGDDIVIASVNRLVPRKGMDRLIRATALVDARMAQMPGTAGAEPTTVRTIIAGVGREERRLKRLAVALRAPVDLVGRVTDSEVAELYGAADLMAMPCSSRWFGMEQEGFGIAFLEAAASGIPQIAGRSGGAHEAIEAGRTGLVLEDPDDVEGLATAIEYLIANPHDRRRMGGAARERATQKFNYDTLAKSLAEAIETCELVR